jgi:DNA-binding MarR family transcriptional regulator
MTPSPRPLEPPDLADLARVIAMHGDSWEQRGLDAEGFGAVAAHQGRLLAALADGPSSVGALTEQLHVTAQAVSKVATDLAGRGYLTVTPDPADGRARLLRLAPLGEAFLRARRKVRNATAREQQRWLGTRDFAELVRMLRALVELYEPPDRRA